MSTRVIDNPDEGRYEIFADDELVGFAAYQKTRQLVVLTHTEVDRRLEGRGLGGELVRGALEDVRRQGMAVLPLCPFVQGWINRHPEYHDLDYRQPASDVAD